MTTELSCFDPCVYYKIVADGYGNVSHFYCSHPKAEEGNELWSNEMLKGNYPSWCPRKEL